MYVLSTDINFVYFSCCLIPSLVKRVLCRSLKFPTNANKTFLRVKEVGLGISLVKNGPRTMINLHTHIKLCQIGRHNPLSRANRPSYYMFEKTKTFNIVNSFDKELILLASK